MTKRHRFTTADYDRIAEMRERGRSYGAIAAQFGCSAKAISWHCLRLGAEPPKPPRLHIDHHLKVPVMRRGGHIVRAFTPDEDAKLTEFSKQGLGNSEIGRRLGRMPNSILGRLMTLARREERQQILERAA